MKNNNYNTHLTKEERELIEAGIKEGKTKTAIADSLGKDKSTIGKEIKLHRSLSYRCPLLRECADYKKCTHGRNCTEDCPDFIQFRCSRRDRSPGACNGCAKLPSCRFNKFRYDAVKAHNEYTETLHDAREGVNLTYSEAKELAEKIGPLLKKGQSPYQIVQNVEDIGRCEKTLYNYIERGVFKEVAGITVMDLRRQTSRRLPKDKKVAFKKRKDRKYLDGRTYKDYQDFMTENPDISVAQMDTVYNDVSNGPFMQTFKIVKCGILLALYHETKDSDDMKAGIDLLEGILGSEVFSKYLPVILTDRGGEFITPDKFEKRDDGSDRTKVFYCDPMQSGQKGSLENNHIELRYILPKETGLRDLGLVNQEALNVALNNINSAPVGSLNGRSPYEMCEFLCPDLYEKLNSFGLKQIEDKKEIVLKPYILKDYR